MYLVASGWGEWFSDGSNWLAMLMVALGLGMVIFVHELGHFAVAKMCGVKCEKFYLGFDIYGLKLFHFKWGETEYGIGILPLGGYVKMLGQDDNPARMREEMERAKVKLPVKTEMHGDMPVSVETDHAVAYDPRSYMAKSVPQRMAIISAGVIMNLIFAVVFAAIAYSMGVKEIPSVVAKVMPGGAAWVAGLRPGDQIIQLGDLKNPWQSDLQRVVPMGDANAEYKCIVRRPGVSEPIELTLRPKPIVGGISMLGLEVSGSNQLIEKQSGITTPTLPGSPASRAEPAFQFEDRIVAIDGTKVDSGYQVVEQLAKHASDKVEITVERNAADKSAAGAKPENVKIEVGTKPLRLVGLALSISPIDAVQEGSPAAEAGIEAGDRLEAIDDKPIGDPMLLSQKLSKRLDKPVKLKLKQTRDGKTETVEKEVKLCAAPTLDVTNFNMFNSPISVSPLGIAFHVLDTVAEVEPGSPADEAKIKVGDVISEASLFNPNEKKAADKKEAANEAKKDDSKKDDDYDDADLDTKPFHLNEGRANWPIVLSLLQSVPKHVQVKLKIGDGKDAREVELTPVTSNDFFAPERGLPLQASYDIRRGESFGDTMSLALGKTRDSLLMVVGFLRKLVRRDIPPTLVGGPIEIGKQAFHFAKDGIPAFLLFLTMISANLAVINFLPIPVLDGGHMVFLAYEGIFRKPVTEKVVNALSIIGFLMLVSLMIFVFSLDLGVVPRISNR